MLGLAVTADGMDLETGIPPVMVVLLITANLAASLTVLLAVLVLAGLARSRMPLLVRLHLATATLAAVVAGTVLFHWNVIGFNL